MSYKVLFPFLKDGHVLIHHGVKQEGVKFRKSKLCFR
jgi:hypothetical protein